MKTAPKRILLLTLAIAACGGTDGGKKPGPAPAGGSGGDVGGSGGSGGSTYGGSGGSAGSGGASGAGGSSGSGGASGAGGSSGSGGASGAGGSAGSGGSSGSGGAPAPDASTGGDTGGGGNIMGWYEAEAIPPNEKAPKSEVHTGGTKCSTMPPKVGERCLAGGGQVTWITEGRQGWLQFNQVAAPADGMYDVTWWYHCGNNDHFGDRHCGGQTNPPTTPSGCRPHNIIVNGVEMMGTYHFPCFPGPFSEIHAATTRLPLKAGGANTIKVYPKQRDSADMDAIQIEPMGTGIGPLIISNNVTGSN